MKRITVYSNGSEYLLEPQDGYGAVELHCREGVRVRRSGAGFLMLYDEHSVYGVSVDQALCSGWCRPRE